MDISNSLRAELSKGSASTFEGELSCTAYFLRFEWLDRERQIFEKKVQSLEKSTKLLKHQNSLLKRELEEKTQDFIPTRETPADMSGKIDYRQIYLILY